MCTAVTALSPQHVAGNNNKTQQKLSQQYCQSLISSMKKNPMLKKRKTRHKNRKIELRTIAEF